MTTQTHLDRASGQFAVAAQRVGAVGRLSRCDDVDAIRIHLHFPDLIPPLRHYRADVHLAAIRQAGMEPVSRAFNEIRTSVTEERDARRWSAVDL